MSRLARALAVAALLALGACGNLPGRFLNEETPPPEDGGQPAAAQAVQGTPGGTVVVQPGDSVYKIARANNVSVRGLIAANNLAPPYVLQAGQTLVLPTEVLHEVVKGDTLTAVARRYGVAMSELARANDLREPYIITIGQRLRIPVAAAAPIQVAAQPAAAVETTAVEAVPVASAAAATPPAASSSQTAGQGTAIVTSVSPSAAGGAGTAAAGTAAATSSSVAVEAVDAEPVSTATTSATTAPSAAEADLAAAVAAEEPAGGTTAATASGTLVPPAEPTPPPAVPAEQVAVAAPQAAAVPQPAPRAGTSFAWPVKGKIVSAFGPKGDGLSNDGINIAAARGSPVLAAENGIVVYAGNEVPGFGNLVLIRHADGWATAYAHNENLLVQKNDKVKRGQVIAYVGATGNVSSPQSHFELRRDNDPVDPVPYLAEN